MAAGAARPGRAHAPGRWHRPCARGRARPSTSTVASMPIHATRTSSSTSSASGGRDDALPPPVGRRATTPRPRAGARRAARGRHPRRADGRAWTRRVGPPPAGSWRTCATGRGDPADEPRPCRRGTAGGTGIHILVGGRVVAAGTPAELAAGLHPRLRLRLDRPLTAEELASLRVAAGGSDVTIDGDRYLLDA